MVTALGRDCRAENRPQRLRFDALDACRRMRREPREQLVHLADRALQRRHHVGAEFGVVGVPLGIAGEQRKLADEILHVVKDEGEAAVEFLESLRLAEGFLAHVPRRASSPPGCRRCGAGRNPPSRAAAGNRARRARRGRSGARGGSAGCRPRPRLVEQPLRARQAPCPRRLPNLGGAPRTRAFGRWLQSRSRIAGELSSFARRAVRLASSTTPAMASPRPPSLTSNSPPGASTMSAKALTIRSLSGGASGPGAAQRFGEPQPFGPIIVAVLEQMLGELHLDPAARAGAGDEHHRGDGHDGEHARPSALDDQSTPVPRSAVARIAITAK